MRLSFPTVIGDRIWWQESRPGEGGRETVVCRAADGTQTALLPPPWNARTRVHEYGGKAYLPVPSASGFDLAFANYADQRLYLAGPHDTAADRAPRPLTPEVGGPDLRFADFVLSPDQTEIWCVQERHDQGKVSRAIVAVPLDGSAADDPDAIRTLATGWDFFAFPTPSPDGGKLAWICWNHPRMPWDGTELRVAPLEHGVAGKSRLVKGSLSESVLAPLWRDDSGLYAATDWTGWWNLYLLSLTGEPPRALWPAEEEFAGPLWQLGGRPFVLLGDGRLAVSHGTGSARLALLDPESLELTDLDVPPFSEVQPGVLQPGISADGTMIAAIAGGPAMAQSLVQVDTATGASEVLRVEMDDLPDARYLPEPQHAELEGRYGRSVHAILYPPRNPDVAPPQGALPPYVVWVHGGPTGHTTAILDLAKAFFTSRGIGIIDVNYGGSSGYGRGYRERLRWQWGIVDVEDAMAAARSLADAGAADRARLAIRGGSAGGWTTLAAVTTGTASEQVFSAAVSYFGVADLRGFAHTTHDFESRYLDGLIGPLPGFQAVYEERAPVGHVTEKTCPVLLLQGLDDPIVPPAQAEAIAADLAAHGIPHAYIAFEGESHGFRKAETLVSAVEAELSFYGQILGFTPPGVSPITLTR